jgi:Flp pilus assembly protein TadG
MKGKTKINHNKLQGQSMIEFAIALPVLLLLILGAMDFARMFSTKVVLTNAAREGANYLARNPKEYPSTTNTGNAITFEAQGITFDSVLITCFPTDDDGCVQGGTATVTVTKGVDLIFGGFLQTFGVTGGPIQLSSTVEMMVQ